MNKSELIPIVARKTGLTRQTVATIIDSTIDSILDGVERDGKVVITNFGTFVKRVRRSRRAKLVNSGNVVLPQMCVLAFIPSKSVKQAVRGNKNGKRKKEDKEKCAHCGSTKLLDQTEGDIPYRICEDCGTTKKIPLMVKEKGRR